MAKHVNSKVLFWELHILQFQLVFETNQWLPNFQGFLWKNIAGKQFFKVIKIGKTANLSQNCTKMARNFF